MNEHLNKHVKEKEGNLREISLNGLCKILHIELKEQTKIIYESVHEYFGIKIHL